MLVFHSPFLFNTASPLRLYSHIADVDVDNTNNISVRDDEVCLYEGLVAYNAPGATMLNDRHIAGPTRRDCKTGCGTTCHYASASVAPYNCRRTRFVRVHRADRCGVLVNNCKCHQRRGSAIIEPAAVNAVAAEAIAGGSPAAVAATVTLAPAFKIGWTDAAWVAVGTARPWVMGARPRTASSAAFEKDILLIE